MHKDKQVEHSPLIVKLPGEDNNILELSTLTSRPVGARKVEDSETKKISQFSHFISAIPTLATAKELSSGKYYVGVHQSRLIPAKGGGMRGMVRDGTSKKFSENARFWEPENLQNLVNFNVAFNLVSMAVAQKHLADISKKLDGIQEIVRNIEGFQQHKRTSKIDAAAESLREAYDAGCTDMGIECANRHEAELKSILLHLQKDIEASLDSFEQKTPSEASEQTRREQLSRLLYEHKVCIELLAVAGFIIGNRASEVELAQKRLHGLVKHAERHEKYLQRAREILSDHQPLLKQDFLSSVSSFFKSSGERYRERVKTISHSKIQKFSLAAIAIDVALQDGLMSTQNNQLLLEIENGEVAAVYLQKL